VVVRTTVVRTTTMSHRRGAWWPKVAARGLGLRLTGRERLAGRVG
jgi:hypothetical protein